MDCHRMELQRAPYGAGMAGMPWGEGLNFRPRCIAQVLLGDVSSNPWAQTFFGLVIALAFVPLFAVHLITQSSWQLLHFFEKVWPTILCVLAAPVAFALCRNWYRGRHQLYDREHYATLFVLAALIAAIVGFANFLLSQLDPRAFAVDSAVASTLSAQYTTERQHIRTTAAEILATCKVVAAELKNVPDRALPEFKKASGGDELLNFDIGGHSIYLRSSYGADGGADVMDVAGSSAFRIYLSRRPKTWGDLAAALDMRAQEERGDLALIELDLNSGTKHFMPTLFVYQAVMDVLQANPNYYKPVSGPARLVAFVYGCLKFLFIGVFVVLATKHFGRTPAAQ